MTVATRAFPTRDLLIDLIERVLIAALFGYLLRNMLVSFYAIGGIDKLILVVSEACAFLFVIFRRTTSDVSRRPTDWVLALAGTTLPLLATPSLGNALAPEFICAPLMLVGFGLQISAKFTLRRSFGVVAANRGVKVGGPYRLIRHPMYAGYLITHIGFLLLHPSAWNLAMYSFGISFQVGRILAEERVLRLDPTYEKFMAGVRYRLIPGVF